jgi:RimJ/RimL family protein N-acetyltransferase
MRVDFTIGTAEHGDAAEIAEVHVRTWQEAYAGIVDAEFLAGLQVEPRIRFWATVLAAPEARRASVVRVARSRERLIGFAALFPTPPPSIPSAQEDGRQGWVQGAAERQTVVAPCRDAELKTLYVRQGWWGVGAGYGLLQAVLLAGYDRGIRRVTLWVLEQNVRARRFYERSGFAPDGDRQREEIAAGVFLEEVRYGADLSGPGSIGLP